LPTFDAAKVEIVWVATNKTPQSAKIFKVVPTKFSPETVSNALNLARLTKNDKKAPTQNGVLAGKDVLSFETRDGMRHLDIIPSQGAIALNRTDVIATPREPVTGVPTADEGISNIVRLLPKLGIRLSEIVTNANGKPVPYSRFEQKDFHKDKATGKIITNIVSQAISLNRQINGIPVWGAAGVFVQFGNESKIADLNLTWRSIQPDGEYPVPTGSNFVAAIKSGNALIRREQAEQPYAKVTIRNVQLYYWENDASEAQSHIYPFAVLNADTDATGDNAKIQLFIPFAK
jgi:sulfur carrier protein ThiS